MKKLNGLNDFRESVVVAYRDGKYHWTWSCDDANSPNYHVRYGVSDSIDGTITYKGVLLQKDSSKNLQGTAHQSDVHVTDADGNDRWLMAYHRHYTPLGVFTSGLGYHRETAIDEITFDADGLMQTIHPTDEGVSIEMADTTALDARLKRPTSSAPMALLTPRPAGRHSRMRSPQPRRPSRPSLTPACLRLMSMPPPRP